MSDAASELSALIERCENLYRDLEFSEVSVWKQADASRKAVGFLPVYAPEEVITAAGMLPVAIRGGGPDLEIIRGDAYFQSYICHLPRGVVELAVSGRLDALDGMLFPSTCDVVRNLSGMWSLLKPDRFGFYIDLPQALPGKMAAGFLRHEYMRLGQGLAKLAGREINDEALRQAIGVYNRLRGTVRKLYQTRSERPDKVPASEAYLLLRAGDTLSPEAHGELIGRYLELVEKVERPELDLSRVVVTGAFCEQPPLELIRTLERAGCGIVDDDLALQTRWITQDLSTEGDPWETLATAYLDHSVENACKYSEKGARAEELIGSVKRLEADGVIFCAPSFCDPALLERPMLADALDKAGIPYTSFKYAENTGQFQVIREQAGTFSDSIKLWSEA